MLVTGGAGFIGSNLIARLLTVGAEIRASLHKEGPVVRDREIEYVPADLTNAEACKKVVEALQQAISAANQPLEP